MSPDSHLSEHLIEFRLEPGMSVPAISQLVVTDQIIFDSPTNEPTERLSDLRDIHIAFQAPYYLDEFRTYSIIC